MPSLTAVEEAFKARRSSLLLLNAVAALGAVDKRRPPVVHERAALVREQLQGLEDFKHEQANVPKQFVFGAGGSVLEWLLCALRTSIGSLDTWSILLGDTPAETRAGGAGDGDTPVLQGLAHDLQRRAAELGQFIQKKDAVAGTLTFPLPQLHIARSSVR